MKKTKKGLSVLKWRALIVAILIAVSTAILVNAAITCHNLYWGCTFVACAISTIVFPLYLIREVKHDDDATDAVILSGYSNAGMTIIAALVYAVIAPQAPALFIGSSLAWFFTIFGAGLTYTAITEKNSLYKLFAGCCAVFLTGLAIGFAKETIAQFITISEVVKNIGNGGFIVGIMAFAVLCFATVVLLNRVRKQTQIAIKKVYCIGGMVTLSGLGLVIISGILNSYFNFVVISIIENIALYLILGGVALLIVTLISHAVFSINLHK